MRCLTHNEIGAGRLAFAPDGRWLFGAFAGRLVGWDLADGAGGPAWAAPGGGYGACRRLACSPCGRWLVQVSHSGLVVYDLGGGFDRPPETGERRAHGVRDFAFHPDGAGLLTIDGPQQSGRREGCIERWMVESWGRNDGLPIFDLATAPGAVRGVGSVLAINPGGTRLAAETFRLRRHAPDSTKFRIGLERTITLWDVASGRVVADRPATDSIAERLVFTADGSGLLADLCLSLIRYDAADLTPAAESRAVDGGPVNDVAVSPDGRWVVAGTGRRVVRLDPSALVVGGEYDFGLGEQVRVAVAPDGLTGAACGESGGVVLFDLD